MFGQQPQQYGYPSQGYPQQAYQPVAQPAVRLSSLDDLLSGNSAKAYFTGDSQPGDSVTGVIEKIETTQVNDFQTKQPAYWNDGRPKEQIHIIIQTQLRDPSVDDDDGRRSLWVKGWGLQLKAFREACKQAGVKAPKPGDTITERYMGLGQRGNAPQPPKMYEFHIEPANNVNTLINGPQAPQQPVRPQPQQGYGQSAYAPQAGLQAPNQGYAPTPVDPWNPQARPVQLTQPQAPAADPMKVQQLKALGKPPQEIAGLLGVPVEAVTAVTDQAQPQNHGGSEQMPETGEF
ncbi:hypothetical protein [Bifidobacterium miconisargentati]|uniref:hypothetical protein n=1 Tax=Bifidobacterium miconisargentati TaxID=2834437 RepID=UPI001BDD8D37|nr:hypothetical protein [Bifidobacterium miconisargentati]MBW3090411.1 hypothetical protein [Bifidobacterium miconisargentati]